MNRTAKEQAAIIAAIRKAEARGRIQRRIRSAAKRITREETHV